MPVQKQKISIGAIQPIIKGTYNPTLSYKYLNIVSTNDASYICSNRLGAPAGVSITDEQFWHCLARDGQDGAVTFANNKDYANEVADKAISPALIKPILDGMDAKQAAFERYGIAYDANRLEGKKIADIQSQFLTAIPGRIKYWNAAGEYEWTCPENVSVILVSACAGGGGGNGWGLLNGMGTGATAGGDTKFGDLLTLGGGKGGSTAIPQTISMVFPAGSNGLSGGSGPFGRGGAFTTSQAWGFSGTGNGSGGGGGSRYTGGELYHATGGAPGGACINHPIVVTGGKTYLITIGAGGKMGYGSPTNGGNGTPGMMVIQY